MQSPFDLKNKTAARIDRFALSLLICLACIGYFLMLFGRLAPGLLAGLSLFALILLTMLLFERSTLIKRDRALRERIGGSIALYDLILMPASNANMRVRDLLCTALRAEPFERDVLRYEYEDWLVRCAQCIRGTGISESDVLAAHRARTERGCMQCVLCSTSGISSAAVRAAEWVDPPIRLISGAQLSALFGRIHPASDEDIARHARRQKKPYSLSRMRLVALSPAKQKKYLLCSFLLLILYLISSTPMSLVSCLLAFLLAILCKKENSRMFRL